MTLDQMQADIDFLSRRAQRAGSFSTDEARDWGISSNSLVSLAYEVGSLAMPSDWYDYAACQRAYAALPEHRRTPKVTEALAQQKSCVAARYPEGEGHYINAMPNDFVSR